jgi:hypothetical protein
MPAGVARIPADSRRVLRELSRLADPTGTSLSLAAELTTRIPLVDKAVDRVAWGGDRDIDTMLGHFKRAIET